MKFSYFSEKSDSTEVPIENRSEMLFTLVQKADKSTRIKVFYWALRKVYLPKSQVLVHSLLGKLLSLDPEILGLDFGDENVLTEIIQVRIAFRPFTIF